MSAVERLERDDVSGRHLFVLDISSSFEVPAQLSLATSQFVCLLAWDARAATVNEISSVARRLLDAGAVYICAWGPGCERLHDIIDEEIVGPNPDPAVVSGVMTTWHANEPLAEAIEFALVSAYPDEAHQSQCGSTVGVSIGSPEWGAEIRSAFSSPRDFVARANS